MVSKRQHGDASVPGALLTESSQSIEACPGRAIAQQGPCKAPLVLDWQRSLLPTARVGNASQEVIQHQRATLRERHAIALCVHPRSMLEQIRKQFAEVLCTATQIAIDAHVQLFIRGP